MRDEQLGRFAVCDCCGKKFFIPSYVTEYHWQTYDMIFCSYTCYRKDFKERQLKKLKRYKKNEL